ncbi:hypothetical protein ACJX0J_037006, partial [Zea mays]
FVFLDDIEKDRAHLPTCCVDKKWAFLSSDGNISSLMFLLFGSDDNKWASIMSQYGAMKEDDGW